jgi:serine O-acetyltransferase
MTVGTSMVGAMIKTGSFRELRYLIASDLYRYHGRVGTREFWWHFFNGEGSQYMIWCRTTKYLSSQGVWARPLLVIARFMTKQLRIRFGISIPWRTQIGPGFYIGHYGGIFVGPGVVIGRNCNMSQGVTLGMSNRGRIGVPTIGDNVYIGPGAKLFGRIKIGDNVAISANAVVGRDVPSNRIVAAAPPEIIVTENPDFVIFGSKGYVNRTDYDVKLR